MSGPKRVVVLGMMTKMPVSGVVWQTLHYLLGFRSLGLEVDYVEAHSRTPSMFTRRPGEDGSPRAAAFLDDLLGSFDLGGRWAFQALHADGRVYGMGAAALRRAYEEADLILNLHGGTTPLPEQAATGRLVYLETDPVQLQVELFHENAETEAFLEPHAAFFTFGEAYGRPGCRLPTSRRFPFRPTRQPVVLDLWEGRDGGAGRAWTTIANWHQPWRDLWYENERYFWSKDREFRKLIDLPSRAPSVLELALSAVSDDDRRELRRRGWRVVDAEPLSNDPALYRDYVTSSRAEFTVAKDQNVRFRSGWFSDRSATYLAAGRPVVTQDTGFGEVLPTGRGLFAFDDMDGAVAAMEAVEADYAAHRRAAGEIARECFAAERVLGTLLDDLGLPVRFRSAGVAAGRVGSAATATSAAAAAAGRAATATSASGAASEGRARLAAAPFPDDLVLEPERRRPLRLPEATTRALLERPLPAGRLVPRGTRPGASVVVVTFGKLPLTRLCLESLLATPDPGLDVVVVDNASPDATPAYLADLARRDGRVRPVLNAENRGFAAAVNQGLEAARGGTLVLLNNDAVVASGWVEGLERHLADASVGAVGPVTNRICNEAQVEVGYRTYGGFLEEARKRAARLRGRAFAIPTLAMFCFAFRRDVLERVGPLDEGFGVGTLEDDDYALRIGRAGLRLLCAEDVFVHHFGQATFGDLVPDGRYHRLLRENRARFEAKWHAPAPEYGRRPSPAEQALRERLRLLVRSHVPVGTPVMVASRGDDGLLDLGEARGLHFPATETGVYAGSYPADGPSAVRLLEDHRRRGARYLLFPRTCRWWLEHYGELRAHLDARYVRLADEPETGVLFSLEEGDA